MKVATWNVNGIRAREAQLCDWLERDQPDVVCLQETKLGNDAFTSLLGSELGQRGYTVALHGEAQWNGVAILSRVGLDDIEGLEETLEILSDKRLMKKIRAGIAAAEAGDTMPIQDMKARLKAR